MGGRSTVRAGLSLAGDLPNPGGGTLVGGSRSCAGAALCSGANLGCSGGDGFTAGSWFSRGVSLPSGADLPGCAGAKPGVSLVLSSVVPREIPAGIVARRAAS